MVKLFIGNLLFYHFTLFLRFIHFVVCSISRAAVNQGLNFQAKFSYLLLHPFRLNC